MNLSKRAVLFIFFAMLAICVAQVQAAPSPRIFYSDLESGPNTGGDAGQGTIVTVYGTGFGATRGNSTVTIGGGAAAAYPIWTDTKIAVRIGSAAATGQIVVNVGGVASNGVPFTVRSGRLYFVSTTGNDSRNGTSGHAWRTLSRAKTSMRPGDIVYVMNGVSEASFSANLVGSSGKPMAIVAYPGAIATIGSTTGSGVSVPTGGYNNWVLAGFKIRGASKGIDVADATNWRIAANDISCPSGSGTAACVNTSSANQIKFLGNNVHDSGSTTSADVVNYESVQFSGTNNVEVGWNEIGNTRSCRALSFFTNGGPDQYGLTVHDNYIHDSVCDGLSFGSVDPSKGAVTAYNNVIKRAGTGPAPGGTEGTYACVRVEGSGQGKVQLLNNTMHDCGARQNSDSGAIASTVPVTATNNIVSVTPGQSYTTANTSTGNLSGSNDLFWGDLSMSAGTVPTGFTNSTNADPGFMDAAGGDFRLQPSSAAIDKGMNTGVATGKDGVRRPQGSAYDIGAYEFAGTPGLPSAGQLTASPTTVDFGNVTTGSSKTSTITVTNSGNANLTISQMTASGTGFTASGLQLPLTLAPGQSASFSATFAPTTAGAVTGSVTLISNASNPTSTVQLLGAGVTAVGALSASPTSLSFGSVNVGSSASKTVTVTASTASVTISQANVTGAGFTVTGLTLPTTLAAGQSATFTVKFSPATAGSVTGSVSLVSTASNTPTAVSLSGTGATATQGGPYSIWSSSTTPAQAAAADSAAVELGVKFKADVDGYLTGIRFYKGSTNTGTHTGSLWSSTGTRLATATFSGETASGWQTVSFANPVAITAGTTYVASYYAPNGNYANNQNYFTTGFDNAPLHALANGGVYAYGASSFPNQTWNASNYWVDVVFTTTAPAAGTLAANPTSLSFGNVGVGSTSTKNVTITASSGSVTISQANVTGAGMSVSGLTLPMTLSAGQSATFQVKFAPAATGSVSGSVSLVSNASNSLAPITVTGTGVTPTAHSVTLTWNASTSSGVTGYNVYRSTQSGGSYTKVNSSVVTVTTFTDNSVVAGTTYYYVATAVGSGGTESAYSSQASAAVPTP